MDGIDPRTYELTAAQKEATLQLYGDALIALRQEHTCMHCGTGFTYAETLGMHLCRTHPGTLRNGTWSCCSGHYAGWDERRKHTFQRHGIDGCVVADHRARDEGGLAQTAHGLHGRSTIEISLAAYLMLPRRDQRPGLFEMLHEQDRGSADAFARRLQTTTNSASAFELEETAALNRFYNDGLTRAPPNFGALDDKYMQAVELLTDPVTGVSLADYTVLLKRCGTTTPITS